MNTVFVYGSLKNPMLRQIIVGREPIVKEDLLSDFIQVSHSLLPYPTVTKSKGFVRGVTFEVSDDELRKLDRYETKHYKKIEVILKSKVKALCYVDSSDERFL
jgi:gamma-glutamylcyclotransferase (GGCT)/AIG2-like uncharacterized protein YtfP